MESKKIWKNILSVLRSQETATNYGAWFSGSYVVDFNPSDNLLIIGVRSSFIKEQIEVRYRSKIEELITKEAAGVKVVFIVAAKTAETKSVAATPIFSGEAVGFSVRTGSSATLNPANQFSNYVVGISNNLAYLAASQVASKPGGVYNPLLVYGPTGVGKTHLLQAIGNEILQKSLNARVVYVSVERFTNEFIESLRNRTQEHFREKYRKADVLLVDDIQFLAGKEGTQDEFFFTINELILSGRQIVCASDRHPKELGKVKERLVSRFLGGMAADIGIPDLEMKMAIVNNRCQEKNVSLPSEVVAFIAQSCDGGVRELEGALISVLAQMKLNGDRVDLDNLKLAFASRKIVRPTVTPGKIIDAVCRHFNVKSVDICGTSRKANLVKARQTLMYLLRRELDLPLTQIGQLLGGRDHSTVIHGVEKVQKWKSITAGSDEILRIQSLIFS